MIETDILKYARQVANKFIKKVETRRAKSVETYADMKQLVKMIDEVLPEEKAEISK